MKKINLKNTAIATRSDAYSVDPRDINVNHQANPRQDYGDAEEFNELKESIKLNGLMQPVAIYIDQKDGRLHLAHGFRRMKAILELITEGVNFEKIRVFEVPNNEESILIQHFVMNTGKKLSDLELGDTLNKLTTYMGKDNFAEVGRRTGIKYEKVVKLINFARKSSTKIKDAVKAKELSLTTAVSMVNALDSVPEQNQALEEAKDHVAKTGGKKIKPENIKVLQSQSASPFVKLRSFIQTVKSTNNVEMDQEFATRLEKLLNAVEDKEMSDKLIMGTFFSKVIAEA